VALIGRVTLAGAQRRVRALMARAWSLAEIAQQAGIDAASLERLLAQRKATPDQVRRIAEVYDRLWDQLPPLGTAAQREAADAALARARRSRWAPPMAWDDDVLDDPAGRPAPGWRPRRSSQYGSADLAEDARFIREHGDYRHSSSTQIAARLGVSKSRLDKACRRAGGAGRETDATVRSSKDAGAGPRGHAGRGQGRVA
jgi:transcriptional regulator with XRE-family HTH domain